MKKDILRTFWILFRAVIILCLCAVMAHAAGQSSENYTIEQDVVSGGGGESGSANYFTEHTTAQPSAIGESSSETYGNFAGFWNVIYAYLPTYSVSGYGMNTPAAPKWRATMAVNINGATLTGLLKYYYTRQRVSFQSTAIASVSSSGTGLARITGTGNGTRITGSTTEYCTGCTFTAFIHDGSPDGMGITVFETDGTVFYNAPGGVAELVSGNFTVTEN